MLRNAVILTAQIAPIRSRLKFKKIKVFERFAFIAVRMTALQ